MILTGSQIIRDRREGLLTIDPFHESHTNPNSYDLTLGPEILFYDETLLSMKREHCLRKLSIPHMDEDCGLILYPGQLYLGHTLERCGSKRYVCCLEGRSSVGRLGIQVHLTAGFGDLGFEDTWTLEITAVKPVEVFSGVRICQAIFYDVLGDRSVQYRGKYTGQTGPRPSMLHKDFNKERR